MNLNGDGLVTPEELHAAGAPHEIVESAFALADADNGGTISLDELTDLQLVCSREQQIGGSGGSLEHPGPLLEPPVPLLTHLHTFCMASSEWLPTRLNPLAEGTCFSQAPAYQGEPAAGRLQVPDAGHDY